MKGDEQETPGVALTVAVCTWNRAPKLRRLLGSLVAATPPPVSWEVLVVDNNSTDATRSVAEELGNRLPLRYVVEPVQGVSAARSRAIREASGELVVFADDDVTVDPGHLVAYAAAGRAYPEAAFFGGAVEVRYEVPPPPWIDLAPMIRTYAYAEMVAGDAGAPIARDKLPYGCNFGFRRSRLGSAAFDPRLGVVGDQRIHGEETAFMEGILDGGGPGRWIPAVVHHWIPPERTTWPYVLRYFVGMGRTRVRQSGPSQSFGAPGAAGAAASFLLRAGVARARRRPTWVGNACLAAVACGELAEIVGAQLR